MNRRWMFVLMLVCALVLVMPRAWAQRPPDTDPPTGVITQDIVMSWDRSAMPGDIEIWAPKTLIAYDRDPAKMYGLLYFTCTSRTDSKSGRCPEQDTGEASIRGGIIHLQFVESRGGQRAELNIDAAVYRADSTAACTTEFWSSTRYAMWSSYGAFCDWKEPAGTGADLHLFGSQLERLTAGHWVGTLELDLRDPSGRYIARYIFNFDFQVTDYDAISIYFPTFDTVAPLVNLDLRYDPIQKVVGGRKQLDMCLYDGLGSQSEYLDVTVRDSGPRPPAGSDFSLWHRDGGSDASQRLDYRVHLDYGGHRLAMKHNVKQQLRGIDSAQLRLVMLPGISQPVYCVPTPLTLETPPTPIASQRPGLYEGELTVVLDVPTAKP
ncbi:CfaE/CblD family pilus tip adhesin [Stenotrophomonas maltophilia]|uniref:CfaE/CblD family pilus tip adhesin n=2 Tax=Stenotrophomonas maltophilia TaxID=40324 RepID=UPI000DF7C3F7|nr:CfaE/CblD family pilus tip adhesin [Stenotrophomonas maltophilia]EMB2831656.1 pilin protein [Stenotrophomonas maltophilia]MBH1452985.1 pilin protein [Stenotrophomonas maltophilia]MBH1568024.1 pilin protein [Stenotrophomonas maltophilia]MBH1730037.1 pilin protein [Stenotrophomonas maltophilia]MBK5594541.1 pilin protein [Stenotrophomonas maltophilia]